MGDRTASPAETLRSAAALLRERTSKATPGPWRVSFIDGVLPVVDSAARFVAEPPQEVGGADAGRGRADADYIALMDPLAGAALADLFESFAACECGPDGDHWPQKRAALKLALLLLGETGTEPAP